MPTAGFHTKLPSESGGAKANPSFCEAVRGPRPDEKSGSGALPKDCLLYTSDAADDWLVV